MTQEFHSLQTLYLAQIKILTTKFDLKESIEEGRAKVLERYFSIIEKGIELQETFNN